MTDGVELPPGNHVVPPDGLHGVTLLDLPTRWMDLHRERTRSGEQLHQQRDGLDVEVISEQLARGTPAGVDER